MSLSTDAETFCEPAPDHPGWLDWGLRDPDRFNSAIIGRLLARREDATRVRVRMFPERRHSNLSDSVHGGAITGFIDIAMFPVLHLLSDAATSAPAFNAMTVETSIQFIAPARINEPLDSVGELLRQTRRLAFLRGVVEQPGVVVASWSAIVRKPGSR